MTRRIRAAPTVLGWALALMLGQTGILGWSGPAHAQADAGNPQPQSPTKAAAEPMVIEADEMAYNPGRKEFVATGAVEIHYRGRIVRADRLTYREADGELTASGHVQLIDPAGHVLHADNLELSSDLRDGFIANVLLIFSDGSRLAAVDATRSGGNRNSLRHAVYSPCKVCEDHPDRKPLWRIRAEKITHKEDEKTIVYKNAVLEFFGIPVGYLPYLSHPDPTVKRKSGFLVPRVSSSSFLGVKFEIPYFFNLAPNRDFTFTPLFTTRESVSLAGQYRERTKTGRYSLDGSITRVDQRDDFNVKTGRRVFRGHVFGEGRFKVDDRTNWGFDVNWTGDDTYLRRYDISDAETLTSRLFVERLEGRDFASASAYGFQGLRIEDDAGLTPFVLPWLEFHHGGEPGWRGSRYDLDGSLMALTRPDGSDVQRLSMAGSWQIPLISRLGTVTRIIAKLRGDLYRTDGFHSPALGGIDQGHQADITGRLAPQFAIDWRLPMVRIGSAVTQRIEPIVVLIAASNQGNPADIPNEDSQSFQFDDSNLFSLNRFNGLDRWDAGSRVSYGVRYSLSTAGHSTEILFGESFRFDQGTPLPARAGLDYKRSDFVGRISVNWSSYLQYFHRFRLDKDTLAVRRNEIDLVIGPKAVKIDLGFLETDNNSEDQLNPDRREINVATRIRFSQNWTADGRFIHSLLENKSILAEGGFFYRNECVEFGVTVRHNFTTDRDLVPSTSVILKLVLTHLG